MFDHNAASAVSGLTSHFNTIAAIGVGAAVAAVVVLKKMGPTVIRPTADKAYIFTGVKFPFPKSGQFVVRNAPQPFYQWGASKPEEVDLKSFTVNISRKGIHRNPGLAGRFDEEVHGEVDTSLNLKDFVKAEAEVEFYVQVNTDDVYAPDVYAPDEKDEHGNIIKKGELLEKGKLLYSGDQNIINAKRTLGEITQANMEKFITPQADSALRTAAAQMTIEEVQHDRESFVQRVKENFVLAEYGFKVTTPAMREFRQAPLSSFNPDDYFDAQGLKKVTTTANESKQAVNHSNQMTETAIALKTQEQTIARLAIAQTQTQADLAQKQEIARMTAERERQIAEIQAQEKQKGDIARIIAEEQTQQRNIEKDREIGVANAQKDRATQVAQQESEQASSAARITKEKTVELASRDKEIALQEKAAEVAEAQQAANTKRAEAVAAEQGVITAQEVAKAERERQIVVIEAKREAEKAAEGRKIEAAADVVVAEAQARAAVETAKGKADAQLTEAKAGAESAKTRAEGSYAETYQPLKAKADGDLAQAAAEKALNDARNALSDEARRQQVDLARVQITPEVVQIFVAAMSSIDKFNVTSFSGAPGLGGAAAGADGGISSGSNVFEQFYDAARRNSLAVPLMRRMIEDMGGDPAILENLPGAHTTPPLPAVSLPPPDNDNKPAAAPAAPAVA